MKTELVFVGVKGFQGQHAGCKGWDAVAHARPPIPHRAHAGPAAASGATRSINTPNRAVGTAGGELRWELRHVWQWGRLPGIRVFSFLNFPSSVCSSSCTGKPEGGVQLDLALEGRPCWKASRASRGSVARAGAEEPLVALCAELPHAPERSGSGGSNAWPHSSKAGGLPPG